MPESPSPSSETDSQGGNMPSYAQGRQSSAEPYNMAAPMAGDVPASRDFYGAFYPQPFMPQPPFTSPYPFHGTLFGPSIDLRNWYGPFPQFTYGPYFPDMTQMYSAPMMENPQMPPASANVVGEPVNPTPMEAVQAPQPQAPQPVQAPQSPPLEPSSIPDPAKTAQSTPSGQTHPSVQVVVQPSQPMPPVQAQQTGQSAPLPASAFTAQSQMPTNVMQPVPQIGQQFASGPLYPQMSGPLYPQMSGSMTFDDIVGFDPELATGGRVAGATFLGILSIPFSLFAPLGFLFSLVGLHLANTYIDNGGGRGVGNLARFFNVVGLILTIAITAAVALYVGYAAGQDGFTLFGQDPIAYINNSEPMQFLLDQWNKLKELWPWG